MLFMSAVTGDRDVVTEADVDTDGLYLSDYEVDDLEAEWEDRCCEGRRENRRDPATWCGCQS
jgi:hypothetical protein